MVKQTTSYMATKLYEEQIDSIYQNYKWMYFLTQQPHLWGVFLQYPSTCTQNILGMMLLLTVGKNTKVCKQDTG